MSTTRSYHEEVGVLSCDAVGDDGDGVVVLSCDVVEDDGEGVVVLSCDAVEDDGVGEVVLSCDAVEDDGVEGVVVLSCNVVGDGVGEVEDIEVHFHVEAYAEKSMGVAHLAAGTDDHTRAWSDLIVQ